MSARTIARTPRQRAYERDGVRAHRQWARSRPGEGRDGRSRNMCHAQRRIANARVSRGERPHTASPMHTNPPNPTTTYTQADQGGCSCERGAAPARRRRRRPAGHDCETARRRAGERAAWGWSAMPWGGAPHPSATSAAIGPTTPLERAGRIAGDGGPFGRAARPGGGQQAASGPSVT